MYWHFFLVGEDEKKKNTPLLKQFQSPIEKSQIEAKVKSLEQNKYMIAHFPGLHGTSSSIKSKASFMSPKHKGMYCYVNPRNDVGFTILFTWFCIDIIIRLVNLIHFPITLTTDRLTTINTIFFGGWERGRVHCLQSTVKLLNNWIT